MKSRVDVAAIAAYIAGGGLAGVFVFVGMVWPKYQAEANGAAIALVAVAGLIRAATNPSPGAGTVSAVIPPGSIPVVTAAPGTGGQSVAQVDPNVVLAVTPATTAPPKQK